MEWFFIADFDIPTGFGLVYWGLTPQQQPGSYQGGEMMMMKSVIWWRKPEYPEETTHLRQVTDETFHTYGLCPVRGLNLGRSGVKQSELRREHSGNYMYIFSRHCQGPVLHLWGYICPSPGTCRPGTALSIGNLLFNHHQRVW